MIEEFSGGFKASLQIAANFFPQIIGELSRNVLLCLLRSSVLWIERREAKGGENQDKPLLIHLFTIILHTVCTLSLKE